MTSRSDFAFLHPLRVRWAECDAQGIVFNVNYFLYFDVAMTEWLRALGYSGDKTLEFVSAHAEADYRASAHFDEEIEVGARCAKLGHKSMTLRYAIFRGEELLTEGAIVYVHVERETQASSLLPSEFIERIMAFEKTPPERASAQR